MARSTASLVDSLAELSWGSTPFARQAAQLTVELQQGQQLWLRQQQERSILYACCDCVRLARSACL